jgi:hypothetical protein
MSWIKIRTNLIDHPKVVRIVSALCPQDVRKMSADVCILGALVRFWSIADQHADGDLLPGMTLEALDSKLSLPGFAQLMADVGWLKVGPDGLYLVNYQVHNGKNAKRRAAESKRKMDVRKMSALCPQDVRIDAHLEKENKSKNKKKKKKEEAEPPTPDQIEFEFPCDGEPDSWPLTKPLVARWSELYPKLDILSECRKALAWVESNPENRKTAGGMTRFLNGWLARSSDRSPARNEIRGPSAQIRSNSSTRPMSERAAEIRARRAQAGQEIQVQIARDTIPGLGVTHG